MVENKANNNKKFRQRCKGFFPTQTYLCRPRLLLRINEIICYYFQSCIDTFWDRRSFIQQVLKNKVKMWKLHYERYRLIKKINLLGKVGEWI